MSSSPKFHLSPNPFVFSPGDFDGASGAISPPVTVRRPGLDTLRVVATLLVVMLHAGVPYSVAAMPGLTWPVRHTATSPTVDVIFWSIEGAIMPLFFLISGYGAAQSFSTKPDRFLATRWRRLGWPLLGAAAVLLPIELYVWLLGWAADGQIPLRKLQSLKLGPFHENLWGLSHLWYLEYLLIFSAGLWAIGRLAATGWLAATGRLFSPLSPASGERVRERGLSFGTSTPLPNPLPLKGRGDKAVELRHFHFIRRLGFIIVNWPLVLFSSVALTLWIALEVVVGFQHSFFPVPAKFVFSGLFFAAGVAEFHRPSRSFASPMTQLAVSGLIFLAAFPLLHRQAAQPLVGLDRCVLAVCLAAYAVLVTQAAWQMAVSTSRPVSPAVSYLTGASFWTYLVHHPLVAIWQIGLRPTGWPALLQFALCTAGTLAMTLAAYEVLVRRTWLSEFLDGRAAVPPIPGDEPTVPVELPARRAA